MALQSIFETPAFQTRFCRFQKIDTLELKSFRGNTIFVALERNKKIRQVNVTSHCAFFSFGKKLSKTYNNSIIA
jgi:hypothetical protein